MFAQLEVFHAAWGTCVVPRHVFDAPRLGRWVGHLRRLHRSGGLPPAAREQLEGLGFQFDLPLHEAQWHHTLHELRRWRAARGALGAGPRAHCELQRSSHRRTPPPAPPLLLPAAALTSPRLTAPPLSPSPSTPAAADILDEGAAAAAAEREPDFVAARAWLARQRLLLAKRRLHPARAALLARVGVRLTPDPQVAARYAELQGLDARERRHVRQRWRREREGAAAGRAAERGQKEAKEARARDATEAAGQRELAQLGLGLGVFG